MGDCIAPPYDVISDKQQKQLYKKNKYNIVRIDRGKVNPADSETDNVYTRAADYLNKWIKAGVLKQDAAESLYAYVQDFEAAGGKWQRSGFVALGQNGGIRDRCSASRKDTGRAKGRPFETYTSDGGAIRPDFHAL